MKEYVISIDCKVTIKAENAASAMSQAKEILEGTNIAYVTRIAPLSEREI